VAESYASADGVTGTARRHGLLVSQVSAWRGLVRAGRLGKSETPGFAAAVIVPDASAPTVPAIGAGVMEIIVAGARVIVDASVDGPALARVVEALRRC
jgi:hypothetical protein